MVKEKRVQYKNLLPSSQHHFNVWSFIVISESFITLFILSHISSFTIYLLYNETPTLNIVFFLKNFSKNQQWGRYIGQNDFFCFLFFAFFCTTATFTDFDFDMSGHNRYIGDISPIFSDFDRRYIVSGRLDTRNIDNISTIYRDIFVHGSNT